MTVSVRAVDRALDVLLSFTIDDSGLSLTQIAERVGIHKSTVHRLLATLEAKRFLHRDKDSGHYHLGFQLVELASLVMKDMDLQRWAEPYLKHLAAETGETVDLAALDGSDVIYLQVIDSPQRIRIAAAVGQRLPAHCTATGKAFLAYLPEDRVTAILGSRLTKHTNATMTSIQEVREDLRAARERGFAISVEEFETDINALAAPILDAGDFPLFVIAVVGPSFRLTRERMMELGPVAMATARAIAREAGLAALSRLLPTRGLAYFPETHPRRIP